MKPSAFDYIRVDTIDEALSVLAASGQDTKILAGGQSLLPLLNMRLARPATILDINRISGLDRITIQQAESVAETLEIGALVRQRVLERFAAHTPTMRLFHAALLNIGHPQTRNRGTVGGSLAHADATAELPLIFVTLGGFIVVQSIRGERHIAANDLFLSQYTTRIEADEVVTSSVWQLPAVNAGIAFKEFRRRHGDFALLAAACTLTLDEQQRVQTIRLGMAGVAETPVLVAEAQALVGEQWTKDRGRAIAEGVVAHLKFVDDAQASAAYRRQLATVLLSRIIEAAYSDALSKEVTHV